MEDRKYLTIVLTEGGGPKITPMAQLIDPQAGTSSEVRDFFFQPLTEVLESGIGFRKCPILSDPEWIYSGVERRGIEIREIGFYNPSEGMHYVYITSEMTLEPGLLVLLYTIRWGIEKIFDETKNKFNQQKSWGTSESAKKTQAHFVCMAHNLTFAGDQLLQPYSSGN